MSSKSSSSFEVSKIGVFYHTLETSNSLKIQLHRFTAIQENHSLDEEKADSSFLWNLDKDLSKLSKFQKGH